MPRNSGKKGRPTEQPAVVTTIVGGRPPGSGTTVGEVPRGIEVLVKKAAVDAGFRATLLEQRATAAKEIDLDLDPAEAAMLATVPAAQLESIIAGTKVDAKVRPAFLGKAAAVMIAALGVGEIAGCDLVSKPKGIEPDRPPSVKPKPEKPDGSAARPGSDELSKGARPDRPVSRGSRPDRPRGE